MLGKKITKFIVLLWEAISQNMLGLYNAINGFYLNCWLKFLSLRSSGHACVATCALHMNGEVFCILHSGVIERCFRSCIVVVSYQLSVLHIYTS